MRLLSSPDRRLGIVCVLLALAALVGWVPFDIETGLIEKVRRQVRIGDAMLPVLGLGFVILGGLMTVCLPQTQSPTLARENVGFLLKLVCVLALSLAMMRWLGPIVASVFAPEETYRALRDTAPWKHLGFVVGGTMLVSGLMALGEGRVTSRGLLLGFLATLALIVLYDLPFEDLLLPPNGDV